MLKGVKFFPLVGVARPTKSLALYIQQAGRGLRIHPGKTDCVINDHGNNVEEHGHILEPREWSLIGKGKQKKKKKKNYKECVGCGAWIALKDRTCPFCQYTPPERVVNVITADFTEAKPEVINPVHKLYKQLLRYAKEKEYKPGWAYFQAVKRLGQEAVDSELSFKDSKRFQEEVFYQ